MWSDQVDENEMDEECLKSSNEQYTMWASNVLLHKSATGKPHRYSAMLCFFGSNHFTCVKI